MTSAASVSPAWVMWLITLELTTLCLIAIHVLSRGCMSKCVIPHMLTSAFYHFFLHCELDIFLLIFQPPWMGPPLLPKILRHCSVKPGRPKLDSRFVLDVNVMDGTLMAPSTPFTKIWRMRNNGNLIWPKGTQLMWIGGDRFSKSASVEIEVA